MRVGSLGGVLDQSNRESGDMWVNGISPTGAPSLFVSFFGLLPDPPRAAHHTFQDLCKAAVAPGGRVRAASKLVLQL